ncbi:MAG: VCBS repeat-containing protein [Candidatus Hydrogenedentes bacterium]|nr:VCBS repeat-containing protein [Candidatus Hydrogenedentota bacterium]
MFLTLVVGWVAISASPVVPIQAKTFVLQTGLDVWDIAVQDVNGDGKNDILALGCDEKSYPLNKRVFLFLAETPGGYPEKPSTELRLETEASVLFLAEVDGKPPKELVAAHSLGATVFGHEDGKFTALRTPQFRSLFPDSAKQPTFLKDTAIDLDADGIEEWMIPVPGGYEIRKADRAVCNVPCDVVSQIRSGSSVSIAYRLPAYQLVDLEDQSHKALAFLSDEFADFAYGENWTQRSRFKIPLTLEEKWEATTQMKDINADGWPDLVVSQMRGTANLKVLTQVYLANGRFTYPEKPTATFEANGALASPVLVDVNKDKKLDILFVTVPFGVRSLINFFILRKVNAQVDVYMFTGSGFNTQPDFKSSVSLDAPEGREQVAYTLGDFTGDGRIDLAFGEGSNKLVVHTGAANRFISSRPALTLALPAFGMARTYDLDANGREDIVLFHPGGDNKQRVEVIAF